MFITLLSLVVTFGLGVLAYTYAGYPTVLWLARATSSTTHNRFDDDWPSVTMIVPVHNEHMVIEQKVMNTQAIDYPGSFCCLFVSDSTDSTNDILRRVMDDEMSLLTLDRRRGKSYAINRALNVVESDVIVFSDGNTMYKPDAVEQLVAPLSDPSVGCVTGQLQLQDKEGDSSEGVYWRYELWIRGLEMAIGTTVSVNGGLLAFRQCDLSSLPTEILVDDLVLALRQIRAGRRIIFEPKAIGTEQTTGNLFDEFARRVRIGAGNYQSIALFSDLLIPRPGHVVGSIMFVSHKVLRWVSPWVLILLFIATGALILTRGGVISICLFVAQLSIYTLGGAGFLDRRLRAVALVRIPAYFLAMNAALALGYLKLLRGSTVELWTVTSRQE